MAKDFVYEKGANGVGDFIYVDLLPQTRRGRQFNSNVILALLFALVLLFVFVFIPYRNATNEFEELNDLNNDLAHELDLTKEEFEGYRIDLDLVTYEELIAELGTYRVDFNDLLDDVELAVGDDDIDGRITFVNYSAELERIEVSVALTDTVNFDLLDTKFEGLWWVESSRSPEDEMQIGDSVEWEKTFILEVNTDVE